MPAGADTVFMQEDVRAEGDAVIVPAGPQARRQPPARRRGRAQGRGRAAGRPAARRAGRGARRRGRPDAARRAAARARRAVLDRRRDRRARRAAAGRGALRRQPLLCSPACSTGSAPRSPISASSRTIPPRWRRRSRAAARDHDLVLTSGGVSTGEADHVRDAVEKIGRLVFWRVAIKPGRPVAMGVIRGASAATARPSSACRAIRSRPS